MSAHPKVPTYRQLDLVSGQMHHMASHARRRDIVVIGASAGGLPALLEILASLPADFDTPVAIVLHRTTKPPRLLESLLARRCGLRVAEVASGDRIIPRTIYVAPPDGHLSVRQDRTFGVEDGRRINHLRSSANPLFDFRRDSDRCRRLRAPGGRDRERIGRALRSRGTSAFDGRRLRRPVRRNPILTRPHA